MSTALERGRELTQKLNPDLERILDDRYGALLPDFAFHGLSRDSEAVPPLVLKQFGA